MVYRSTSNLATDLGRIGYQGAYRIQKQLLDSVKRGTAPGFLLFLEHDPVYTIGRKPISENYSGVEVVETERGGDVTYHGPGQAVIYPIVRVSNGGNLDVRGFVHFVEGIVMRILADAGYESHVGEEPGIWIDSGQGERKVASIGMAIDHGVSYHGISINISEEVLDGFHRIRPCGLDPVVMSYAEVSPERIKSAFLESFSKRFGKFSVVPGDIFLSEIEEQSQ